MLRNLTLSCLDTDIFTKPEIILELETLAFNKCLVFVKCQGYFDVEHCIYEKQVFIVKAHERVTVLISIFSKFAKSQYFFNDSVTVNGNCRFDILLSQRITVPHFAIHTGIKENYNAD